MVGSVVVVVVVVFASLNLIRRLIKPNTHTHILEAQALNCSLRKRVAPESRRWNRIDG